MKRVGVLMDEPAHTVDDNFQHFMSYSGLWGQPVEILKLLRMAYRHGANASEIEPGNNEPPICPVCDFTSPDGRCNTCGYEASEAAQPSPIPQWIRDDSTFLGARQINEPAQPEPVKAEPFDYKLVRGILKQDEPVKADALRALRELSAKWRAAARELDPDIGTPKQSTEYVFEEAIILWRLADELDAILATLPQQ